VLSCSALALAPVAASAHEPTSDPEGPPPPVGQSAPEETTFKYKGELIATEDAASRGLACHSDGESKTRCYDTEQEMDKAENLKPREGKAAARNASSRRTRAQAATHEYSTLRMWEYHDYRGWVLSLERHCIWDDVPGGYENKASSAASGSHTGWLSDFDGGRGWQFEISPHAAVQDLPGETDNDAESRARVCL
jgi:hypothetical protein